MDFQVAVVGGGPSGSRTAALLARDGISVLLLEAKHPGNKILCGGLLNHEAQVALGCDLPASVCVEPHTPMLEYHDLDNRILCRFDPRYRNISRPAFDTWLLDNARCAGVVVRYGSQVSSLEPFKAGIRLKLHDGDVSARLVVDATGWHSLSRRVFDGGKPMQIHAIQGKCQCSLPEDAMWAIYKSNVTPYYGWVIPKGEGQFLIGAGFSNNATPVKNPKASAWSMLEPFTDYIHSRGFSVEPLDPKPHGSPIACISSMSQLWWGRHGVIPVGEAAGMVSPSSGDGISYCLQGAAALSRVLQDIDFSRLDYNSGGLAESQHCKLATKFRNNLRPALCELNFNIAKAWVASRSMLRGMSARLLPLYLRRNVRSLPWIS